jgi:hypothetical protein
LAVRDGGEQRLVQPKGPARQPLGVAARSRSTTAGTTARHGP